MLRVGLVGAGFMGRFHAAAWSHTPATLAAIFAADENQMRALCEHTGAQAVESLDALLDAVDVVDICTPTHLHHEMALRAAAAGKHIVCEKPLARTPQQAAEMIDACRAAGVKLLPAHVVRFFPQYALAKQTVDQGAIGRVAVVRLTRVSSGPAWAADSWFTDFDKSGGMMLDLMLHDFDYARWIAGEVESVFAKSVGAKNPGERNDYGLAILRHTGGALSNVEGGWVYPPPMFRTALEIAGDGGLIEHPADSAIPLGVYLRKTDQDSDAGGVPTSPLAEDPYTTEIKHFYDVIAHDAPPRVTAEDGLAALRIAFAAMESARTGRRVRIEEVQ
mgnify:CR=1 FL=1